MTRRLAQLLSDLALHVLPPGRRAWGEGMKSELDQIASDRLALAFAAGCLVAGLKEWGKDVECRVAAGRWSVALLTTGFALFHVGCALHGVRILMGETDPFYEALMRGGSAERSMAAAYRDATPVVVCGLFGLGVSHLVAAVFLMRSRIRPFAIASASALMFALLLSAAILAATENARGLPAQFAALVVQALAVPLLWRWQVGRPPPACGRFVS